MSVTSGRFIASEWENMFNWEADYITRSYLQVSFGDAGLFHTELQIFHFSVKQEQ